MSEPTVHRPAPNTAAERSGASGVREQVTIALRPVGGPIALGLFGLAAATLVLSGLQLGSIGAAETKNVGVVLLCFAFGAQALASVVGFAARDGVAATAMGVLAPTWLVTGVVLHGAVPGSTINALGLFLVFAGRA